MPATRPTPDDAMAALRAAGARHSAALALLEDTINARDDAIRAAQRAGLSLRKIGAVIDLTPSAVRNAAAGDRQGARYNPPRDV